MEHMTNMDNNFSEILDEFMRSALVIWVHLFDNVIDGEGDGPLSTQYLEVNSSSQHSQQKYLRLTNGIFLNEVMRVIDPNPKVEQICRNENNDEVLRVQNFSVLNRHLRSYYQEDLQQLLLMPLPNVAVLGRDPLTEAAVEELRSLLLLLLGCAVQCERKEEFIQQIQSLDIETQAAIATCIQEVTQDPSNVLPRQWGELCTVEGPELQGLFSTMAQHIQALLFQRDSHLERIAELYQQQDLVERAPSPGAYQDTPQGLSVQLADSRARLRRMRQELEEKGDQLLDYKQEVQAMEAELRKLRQENRTLQGEARAARSLRDELDCLRERAGKADRLQSELQSCAHRLRSLDLYRTQLQEQQQYCATLQETRALLEEQLGEVRARCSSLRELERDNLLLRQRVVDLEGERDTERQRVDELLEENMSLEAELKHSLVGARNLHHSGVDSEDELSYEADLKPLSVEVSEASSWRLLGAENENAELRRRLEQLQAERENCADVSGPTQLDLVELLEEREKLKVELQKQADTWTGLQEDRQSTLKELQNMKNENARLQKCLELLREERRSEKTREASSKEERSDGEAAVAENEREEGEGGREAKGKGEQRKEEEGRSGASRLGARREEGEGEEISDLKEREDQLKTTGDHDEEPKGREGGEGEKETRRREPLEEEEEMDSTRRRRRTEEAPGAKESRESGKGTGGEKLRERGKTEGEEEKETEECGDPRIAPEEAWLSPDPETQLQQALGEVERLRQEGQSQAGLLQELRSSLAEEGRRTARAEQRLAVLEAESQGLRRAAESLGEARKQMEVLRAESAQMEEDLARLRSQAELQRLEGAVIAQLQGERAQLEREKDALRSAVDTLRAAARKGDQLELANQTLKAEMERLGRSLESSRRREEELGAELREAGLEAESLGRGRSQAVLEAARLEQEKEALQDRLDAQLRENRQREREGARLRQQLESTASALEHSNQRACSLEAENRHNCQELAQLQEDCEQLREQERERERQNQQLCASNAQSQAQLSTLTQELANEKLQSQERANEVARLGQELERLKAKQTVASSPPPEALKEGASTAPVMSSPGTGGTNERLASAPANDPSRPSGAEQAAQIEPSAGQTLTQRAERDVPTSSASPPISQEDNTFSLKATNDFEPTEHDGVHQARSGNHPMASSPSVDKQESMSERLIEVERQNAALQTEKGVMLSQVSQLQSATAQLQEQLDSLHRHSYALQENCASLQALNTKLQTEQASLSSQHASVWARCSESEARAAVLEAESKAWSRDREEVMSRGEALRRDHERLSALQQRQEAELEALLSKHSQLKTSSRNLEAQHRELEGRYQELLERRAQMEEGEEVIRAERERLEREVQTRAERERELERLREENDRLHALQKESVQVQTELLAQGSVLRGELSAAQLERTRLEGELSTLREQNQHLDLNNARLASQYQLLTQLKGNMEEETRHLVEQNQSLARENRTLLERSLESRDQHHLEQRQYLDKLNELRREKQKLVEKIMDQYRVLEPSVPLPNKAKKSNWIADRMKKLIKPRGGREGRAQFIAAGSIENLAEASEAATSNAQHGETDPLSAPGSPSPRRKASSVDSEDQARVTLRSGRRKLGSRHGWGLGRGAGRGGGGGVSQSFSPGDHRPSPRDRYCLSGGHSAIWEAEDSPTLGQERLSEGDKAGHEESLTSELKTEAHGLSSGLEDCLASDGKNVVRKTDSLHSM